jgi:hypothetical protein
MNPGSTIIQGISPKRTHQTGGMGCCLWAMGVDPSLREDVM